MMLKKNSRILLVIVSLLLIPIWGLTTLDIETATRVSTFIGFLMTFFLYMILVDNQIGKNRYLFLIGPSVYLIAYIFARHQFGFKEFFFAPIPWLFIATIAWIHINNHKLHVPIIFFLLISYVYSFHMYPTFERLTTDQPDLSMKQDESLASSIQVYDYSFINSDGAYEKLNSQTKGFIIETWNEKCGPCLASIRDLEPLIDSLGINHIFLYGEMGSKNLSIKQVYEFAHINDKDKILIDPDNHYLNDMNIASFPYLLFFNSKGELVDNLQGYHPSISEEVKDKIIKFHQGSIANR